jgi:hypothetical protein
MKKALAKWYVGNLKATPHQLDVRNYVAKKLFDGGWLEAVGGGGFRAGYSALRITEKGREAVVSPLKTV